jgi:type IX secretion system PorP/SprF family membrane protein
MRTRLLFFILFSFVSAGLRGQDITNFTQFFFNPYCINPSYAGIEGQGALFLTYRKQWAGIEGAPSIANFSIHSPTQGGVNYGLNVTSDSRGILNTSSAMVTGGYTVTIDKQKYIRIGISTGAAFNSVDAAGFDDPDLYDPGDPVLVNLQKKNTYLIGNAGISFHLNSVHFGVSLPNIFTPAYISTEPFSVNEVKPFQSMIIHASNRYYFAKNKHVFEPYFIYRMNQDLPGQFEAAAVVHLNHVLWVGGSYKQDFGMSGLGGIKLKNTLAIGASYSLKNTGVNELNSPTYEVSIGLLLGKRRKNTPAYSFVNAEKEKKGTGKSASEKLAEKRRKDALARKQQIAATSKKQADLAAKKKGDLAKKNEEDARKQAEEKLRQDQANRQREQTQPEQYTTTTVQDTMVVKHKPRFSQVDASLEVINVEITRHDEQDEKERISRLTSYADDPDAHHGEDHHPNGERHEFVKHGDHKSELDVADYVVTGVFKDESNARQFSNGLKKLGFKGNYGHLSEKNLWYVYIVSTDDINKAKAERDKYRKMKIFRDAWLLTVHH